MASGCESCRTAEESLRKAFVTTLLLAGSAASAEAALLEAVVRIDREEELLEKAVEIALRMPPVSDLKAHALLPLELRLVLKLSSNLRRCFVLRMLLGWPSEQCARMLQMESSRIDEQTCIAARALAEIAVERVA